MITTNETPLVYSNLFSYFVSCFEICAGQVPVTVGALWLSQVMEQPTGTPTTPAGVLAHAGTQVVGLAETLWAAKSSEELVDTVEQLEVLRAQLAAIESSVLAEVHARKVPQSELAWGSTAEWFT